MRRAYGLAGAPRVASGMRVAPRHAARHMGGAGSGGSTVSSASAIARTSRSLSSGPSMGNVGVGA
jgi:hypothetical protein